MIDIPNGNIKADLVYKCTEARDLALTFFPPLKESYEKAPVYFIIPGGGWHVENRQSMIEFSQKSVDALRCEGFAVVSIDYRIHADGIVMNDIITDCFDAARYIAHFADILKVDKDKFFVSGHSAGAHLALMVSYATSDDFNSGYEFSEKFGVKAVAAMSAPTALYDDSVSNLRDVHDLFTGCDTKEEMERTSPISYAKKGVPPTLLAAGTSDYLVFSTSSEMLYEKLIEAGAECELVLSVCGSHSFEKIHKDIEPSLSQSDVQDIITEFILKHI